MGNEEPWLDLSGANSPSPLSLAHTPSFALGRLTVEPATRSIAADDGRTERLEPLVMQVLIVLASASGSTLSRDDLIAACWDGRIVTEDAINRVISRLRKALERLGGDEVRLETIPKVGYRLSVSTESPDGDEPAPRSRKSSRYKLVLAAAGIALAAGAGFWWTQSGRDDALRIGVEPVLSSLGDREARRFASNLTSDLARFSASISGIALIDATERKSDPVRLLVRIAVDRDPEGLIARARLVETGGGQVLWSRDFRDAEGDLALLRDRTSVGIAGVIRCGLERAAGPYGFGAQMRLYLAACDALERGDWQAAESYARQIVRLRPKVAAGWGCLAMTILMATEPGARDEARRLALARRYAERAIALDPRSGRAYIALSAAGDKFEPRSLDLLAEGIGRDPDQRSLHSFYATHLFNMGYVEASVRPALRALALDPASRNAYSAAVRRLLASGRVEQGFAVQRRAEELWPGNLDLAENRSRMLHYGDPAQGLRQLRQLNLSPSELPPLTQLELEYRLAPSTPALLQLQAAAEREFANEPSSAWYAAMVFARIGATGQALDWLKRASHRRANNQWSLLFWPDAAAIRREPEFFRSMSRLGLVEFWRKRGVWPDFCSERGLKYDCRREAERLANGAKPV